MTTTTAEPILKTLADTVRALAGLLNTSSGLTIGIDIEARTAKVDGLLGKIGDAGKLVDLMLEQHVGDKGDDDPIVQAKARIDGILQTGRDNVSALLDEGKGDDDAAWVERMQEAVGNLTTSMTTFADELSPAAPDTADA